MLTDVHSEVIFSESHAAGTGASGAGTALDTTGCNGGMGIAICNATAAAGSFKLTESATSGGTYTDCATTDYPNDVVTVEAVNGNAYLKFDMNRGDKPFLKVYVTHSGSGKEAVQWGVPGGHQYPVTQGS